MFKSIKIKLVFAFILVTVVAVILTAIFARFIQKKFVIERAKKIASFEVNSLSRQIKEIIDFGTSDLVIFKKLPLLKYFLENRGRYRKDLEYTFLTFAERHKIFNQIRFLDLRGNEVIRINFHKGRGYIVPIAKLQPKSHRYYFKKIRKIGDNDIYISPLDLNIENKKIEMPFQPVMRLGTPVFDRSGIKAGYMILNIDGKKILKLFEDKQNKKMGNYYLVDEKGYYLFHPDKTKTFTFMFGKNETLAKYNIKLSNLLKKKDFDIMLCGSKYFGDFTIYAFKKIILSSGNDSPQLTIIYTVDNPELLLGFHTYLKAFIYFSIIAIILCVIIAALVSLNISAPILSLVATTKKIYGGDLSARARLLYKDEIGQLGFYFDKMAEQLQETIDKLKRSENEYKNLFENSLDSIFLIDKDGNIKNINRAGKKLLGIEYIEKGINLFEFIEEMEPALLVSILRKTGKIEEREIVVTNKNGERRTCSLTAHVRDARNMLIQGIIRDITERKKRHEERLKLKRIIEEEIILAEERERRKIGELIHEQLAQDIAFVYLKTQEIYQRYPDDKSIEQIGSTTEKMLQRIRGTIFDLCPVIVDEQGVIPAISCYIDNFQNKTGLKVTYYSSVQEDQLQLSMPQKFYVFRIIKELLNNIWKHANAKEAVISIIKREDLIRIVVDDDGRGFDYEEVIRTQNQKIEGIGLLSIKAWLTHLNGSLVVESQVGEGTRIIIEIPVTAGEEDLI